MMRIVVPALILVVLTSLPLAADAQADFGDRRLQPIEDPLQVTFTGDPAKLTRANMKQAIEIAALAKDWKIVSATHESFELTTIKNGRHVLKVVVPYTETGCEIRYKDSVEMMYREVVERGQRWRVIHRNYNVWVRELATALTNKVALPVRVSAPGTSVAGSTEDNRTVTNGNFTTRSFEGRRRDRLK